MFKTKKISASYNGINPNFVIGIKDGLTKEVEEPYRSLYAICYNIISRGGVRSRIPDRLSEFSEDCVSPDCQYTIPKRKDRRKIDGDKGKFFEEQLIPWVKKVFSDKDKETIGLICDSFIADCDFKSIAKTDEEGSATIDFYSPLINLPIIFIRTPFE